MTEETYDPTEGGCLEPGKKKIWKFVRQTDFVYRSERLKGRACDFNWMSIADDGTITVKGSFRKGYAWDGCTPKGVLLDLMFGTPDGKAIKHKAAVFGPHAYYPITYFGSMVHDMMYQYKRCGLYTRKEADLVFRDLLKESGFFWAYAYYAAVRSLGWFFGGWKYKNKKQVLNALSK